MASQLTVAIPGLVVGEAYVTYTIVVSKGESSWSVRRRFQDFDKLHAAVKKAASNLSLGADLPELPPKKLRMGMSKFAPDFVEERRVGLENYLQQVVALVDPERCEPLDDFLVYAEHWLREAVEELARISELQHVVRVLRQAADAAASVHTKRTGSGAVPSNARRKAADSDEDDDGPGEAAPATTSTAGGPELLSLLKDSVRMLGEYASMVRSSAEDAEERTEATAASNAALTSKLRAKQEDIADARQMMTALREARARECEKERVQLGLVAAQARTVAAELARVQAETGVLQDMTAQHHDAISALRQALVDWEKGISTELLHEEEDSASTPALAAWPGPQAAPQLLALTRKVQQVAQDADAAGEKYSSTLSLPPKANKSSGEDPCAPLATRACHGVVQDMDLSGPSLQAALLLQAVAADTVGLVSIMQKVADGHVKALPKPVSAAAAESSQQAGSRTGGKGGGAGYLDSANSPSSTATASTGAGSAFASGGASARPARQAAGATVGDPFGGGVATPAPIAAAPTAAPAAVGNPFGGSPAKTKPAAVAARRSSEDNGIAAPSKAPAPAPAPAPAAKSKGNPFGGAAPAPGTAPAAVPPAQGVPAAKPKAGNPFA